MPPKVCKLCLIEQSYGEFIENYKTGKTSSACKTCKRAKNKLNRDKCEGKANPQDNWTKTMKFWTRRIFKKPNTEE
jgi:hypothetical protein